MARKELINQIVKLYQKLGGNVSDVLGTRTNVSFIGKGEPDILKMDLNTDALGVLPQSKALEELKDSVQFAAGDKLNDLQAGKLLENMSKMDEFYNPAAAPSNITDLATGTRNLDREGLASLRLMADDFGYVAPEEAAKLKELKPIDEVQEFTKSKEDVVKDLVDRKFGKGYFDTVDDVSAPTGAGLEAIKSVKNNSLIVDDLVEKVYQMSGVAENAKPVARANARDFLNRIKDMEDPDFPGGTTLSGVMEADDLKFATEGGGGGFGDPLLLVQKYFGPRVASAVAKLDSPDDIQKFAENLVKVKDARGNSVTSRFFDPELIDPNEFADGGRVPMFAGGAARMGFQALRKYGIQGKDISRLFASLGTDKSLVGKEKTEYFRTLNKVLKNPDDFPDEIMDIQKQLGIDVGIGFRNGGLAGILEV
tara:strand:+ start:645 stop:1913 length:1269 start_codon:yes stop_codon:yes gene_type:complete